MTLTSPDRHAARPPDSVMMRCLLVDDNTACLERARALLARQGLTVAGTASSTAEALWQASALRPDVAIVDIGLGSENGFDLAVLLSKAGIAVIMVSAAPAADPARPSPSTGLAQVDDRFRHFREPCDPMRTLRYADRVTVSNTDPTRPMPEIGGLTYGSDWRACPHP